MRSTRTRAQSRAWHSAHASALAAAARYIAIARAYVICSRPDLVVAPSLVAPIKIAGMEEAGLEWREAARWANMEPVWPVGKQASKQAVSIHELKGKTLFTLYNFKRAYVDSLGSLPLKLKPTRLDSTSRLSLSVWGLTLFVVFLSRQLCEFEMEHFASE